MSNHIITPADLRVRTTFADTDLLLLWNPTDDTALPYPITIASLRSVLSPHATVVQPSSIDFDHLSPDLQTSFNDLRWLKRNWTSSPLPSQSVCDWGIWSRFLRLHFQGLRSRTQTAFSALLQQSIRLLSLAQGFLFLDRESRPLLILLAVAAALSAADLRTFALRATSDADARTALRALYGAVTWAQITGKA